MSDYKVCKKCVMDTTDPNITFNNQGVCSHCLNFDQAIAPNWVDGNDGNISLENCLKK